MTIPAGIAYRIRLGDYVALLTTTLFTAANFALYARIMLEYDDGSRDFMVVNQTTLNGNQTFVTQQPAAKNGWVIALWTTWRQIGAVVAPPQNSIHITAVITPDAGGAANTETSVIAEGFVGNQQSLMLGLQNDRDNWSTWIFQGTVLEDATVGTHTCSLTVSPQAGCELEILYGSIVNVGLAANNVQAYIDDGSGHTLAQLLVGSAAGTYTFPYSVPLPSSQGVSGGALFRVAGAMRVILQSTTSTVSDTQTFAIACRIRRGLPAATLADSTGTPTITVNVNATF